MSRARIRKKQAKRQAASQRYVDGLWAHHEAMNEQSRRLREICLQALIMAAANRAVVAP